MDDRRELLQTYSEALAAALSPMGVDWIDWQVIGGKLLLDVRPSEVFPYPLRVVPGAAEETCFVTNDLAGVFYVITEGGEGPDRRTVESIRATCETVLDLLDEDIIAAMRACGDDRGRRIAEVDYKTLVRSGHLAASIISVVDAAETLGSLAAEVPCMLPADEDLAAIAWGGDPPAGDRSGEKRRRVYIGADAQTVHRLRDLDRDLYMSTDPASRISVIAETAALFGVPPCCLRTHVERLTGGSGKPEHVAWLRDCARFGDRGRGALPLFHERETNYLAARSHGLVFFDHWPCSPRCEATIERNRRRIADLFDAESRVVVERILGTSYMGWADGRLLPFIVDAADGETLRVSDARHAPWSGLTSDGIRRFFRPRVPGGGRAADLRGLRPTRRGWRWHDGERWRRTEGDREGWLKQRPPLVALFGDASPLPPGGVMQTSW